MKSEDRVTRERRLRIEALGFDKQKFAYEMLRKELDHRRDKAWRIFSWASTILLGTVAGMVAILSRSGWDLPYYPHRTLLTFALYRTDVSFMPVDTTEPGGGKTCLK